MWWNATHFVTLFISIVFRPQAYNMISDIQLAIFANVLGASLFLLMQSLQKQSKAAYCWTWREPCCRKRGTPECGGTVMLLNNMSILFFCFYFIYSICILLVFVFVFLRKTQIHLNDNSPPCSRPKAGRFKICGELAFPFVSAVLEPDLHLMLNMYNIS